MADFPPLPTTNLSTLCEMFPSMQRSVVEMILEDVQGDGEKAIELLLTMSEPPHSDTIKVDPEPAKPSLSQVSATLLSPTSSSNASTSFAPTPAISPSHTHPDSPSPLSVSQVAPVSDVQQGQHVLVMLRGLPGSGKSSLAARLLQSAGCGVCLSTDEYFIQGGCYTFNPGLLGKAHEWNQKRAVDAVKNRERLVVIDNTNTMAWEMRPYVELAVNNRYKVHILEPDTPWKYKPKILAVKNSHSVPKQKIEMMLDRYEKNLTVEKLKSMWNISEKPDISDNVEKQEEDIFESEDEATNEDIVNIPPTVQFNPDVREFIPAPAPATSSWRNNEVVEAGSDSPDIERLVAMFPHLSLDQATTLYNQHQQNTAEVISTLLEAAAPASPSEKDNHYHDPFTLREEDTTIPMTLDPIFAVTLQEQFGSPVDDSLLQFLKTGELLSLDIPVTMARQLFSLWQLSLQSILTTKPELKVPVPAPAVSDWGGAGIQVPPKTVLAPNAVEHYEKQMLDKALKNSMSHNVPQKAKPTIIVKPLKQEEEKIKEEEDTPELEQFIEQRDMLYRKAMETRGSHMQGAASYYAAQARELNTHIKHTQKQTQMEMFLQANKDSPNKTIDLHYLQTSDAIKQLQQFISQKEAQARSGSSGGQTVDVITGKGNRSENGKSRLRPAVQNWLDQKKYFYTEVNIGCFRVRLKG